MATEFARKVPNDSFYDVALVASILAQGNSNSSSCLKTVETLAFSYIEALSLMDGNKLIVPQGLFTEQQTEVIKLAGKDLIKN